MTNIVVIFWTSTVQHHTLGYILGPLGRKTITSVGANINQLLPRVQGFR